MPKLVPTALSTEQVVGELEEEIHEIKEADGEANQIHNDNHVQPSSRVKKNHSIKDVIGDLNVDVNLI